MGFININSLRNKYICLKDIFDSYLVDYFSVLETKLDNSFPGAQFCPRDFAMLRVDVSASNGGIMTFIHCDIPHNCMRCIEINNEAFLSLCVQLTVNREKWIIATTYRPPFTDIHTFLNSLNILTGWMVTITDMIIIIGDTNVDVLRKDRKSTALKNYFTGFNLSEIVKEPTCFKATPSLIDHMSADPGGFLHMWTMIAA